VSFFSLLIHTCTIKRRTYGARDALGQHTETWADLYTGRKCRLTSQIGFIGVQGSESHEFKQVSVHEHPLFLPAGTSIQTDDRVADIHMGSTGAVIDAGPFDVVEVRKHYDSTKEHHVEAVLHRIKAGGV
jgi:hypothetical protein